jgi:hypothetical protein
MSNAMAIATVTETLRQALLSAVGTAVPGATVSTARPDGSLSPPGGVHLYLYQITPNAAWRNADLPTRRSDGSLAQRPQAALDLYYLLSFYGDGDLVHQRLLGSVVRLLHAQPSLTPEMIRATIIATPFLSSSDLAEQIEKIRLMPVSLNMEELSKLWAMFADTPHALSVAYQVSVVLIEADSTPQSSLPVRERIIRAVPFSQPVIEAILSNDGDREPIVFGGTLRILGQQLRGDVTQVRIGGIVQTPAAGDISSTEIRLPLPAGLQAGIQAVQVLHLIEMEEGIPETQRMGVESNVMAFVFRPTINRIVLSNTPPSAPRRMTLQISPVVGKTQRVFLLLNEQNPPPTRAPHAYRLDAPTDNGIGAGGGDTTGSILFRFREVEAAVYLVRIQVDGAESPLAVDPNTHVYTGPTVTLP